MERCPVLRMGTIREPEVVTFSSCCSSGTWCALVETPRHSCPSGRQGCYRTRAEQNEEQNRYQTKLSRFNLQGLPDITN